MLIFNKIEFTLKMNALEGYFLGFFTIVFIMVTFWLFATLNNGIADFYRKTIGNQICTVTPSS